VDTKQFIASLVSSLAWPAAVVVVVLLFREQIVRLLAEPMKRLKAGPVDIEFDRIAATVEAQLGPASEGASGESQQLGAQISFDAKLDIARQSAPGSALRDLAERAEIWPSGAVIEGFGRVEEELRNHLEAAGHPQSLSTRLGAVALARRARDAQIITPETFEAVEGLAVLRNMSAHGRGADVTQERALDYLALVDGVLFAIQRDAKGQQGGN
jgi:hypothetical protein